MNLTQPASEPCVPLTGPRLGECPHCKMPISPTAEDVRAAEDEFLRAARSSFLLSEKAVRDETVERLRERFVSLQTAFASVAPRVETQHDVVAELAKLARRSHFYCEDNWYSCPKAEDGCADDQWEKDVCNCGADDHNAKVDAIVAAIALPLVRSWPLKWHCINGHANDTMPLCATCGTGVGYADPAPPPVVSPEEREL